MSATDGRFAKIEPGAGKLLGLTYVPEQQIGAWHWHDTDGVFEHLSDFVVTRKDVPDPKTCPIDGPFWEGGVSSFGRECSDANIATCAEVAQRLYESGRWQCAKAYHGLICDKAPEVTKPPPGIGAPMISSTRPSGRVRSR